jgi:hypothetical protein
VIAVPPGFYNTLDRVSACDTKQTIVTTTAGILRPHSPDALGILIVNAGTDTVFIGEKGKVIGGDGHALLVGNTVLIFGPMELWAIANSSTQLVTWLQGLLK